MTKLARKAWKTRVLRYAEKLPSCLFDLDPQSGFFKSTLKSWILSTIEPDGDYIFKGKVDPPEETDWLALEVELWNAREEHYILSQVEMETL